MRPSPVQGMVKGLTPGYFALVMASGIISLGLHLRGFAVVSWILFGLGAVSFTVLCVLNVWRFLAYREDLADDFRDPRRAFGFFTFVAGTNVLGARAGAQGWAHVTAWLLVVAGLVWIVLGYVVPWMAVLGRDERPVVAWANGTWFIWVVASQSVAVAAASLEPVFAGARAPLAVLAVISWSVGVICYAATALFVSLRVMLYPLNPQEFDAPYWVSMGAVAITVVAGARIVEMTSAPMVDATRGLIAGMAVVFWAFATWLIPVLVASGVWRHGLRKVPLRYDATLWSIIFPLGMYAVAGIYLGNADDLPLVETIGSWWLWVALVAYVVTLGWMTVTVVRMLTTAYRK